MMTKEEFIRQFKENQLKKSQEKIIANRIKYGQMKPPETSKPEEMSEKQKYLFEKMGIRLKAKKP